MTQNQSRENPFQPPAGSVSDADRRPLDQKASQRARMAFYAITFAMLVPAFYNAVAFDAMFVMGSKLPPGTIMTYRAVNFGLLASGFLLLFMFGFPLLQQISLLVHGVFARDTDPVAWQAVLYRALYHAVILSIPGSALWLIWVFAVYQLRLDFATVSYAIAIPANVLGVYVYVPLLLGWYRLAFGRSTPNNSDGDKRASQP